MTAYPHATWRLIHSEPADGPTHMAIEEAIWQAVSQGASPPTLRLFAWVPPCLSLGRHQPSSDADQVALQKAGYDLVRRVTGGRAILHTDELTYSVTVPLQDPRVQGDILTSCQQLGQGLLEGLTMLGVQSAATHTGRQSRTNPVCFESPGQFEITVNGKKLIGSAQMRGRGTLLQHGTLPLHGDISRICHYLSSPPPPDIVRERATTLQQVLGKPISWDQAATAITRGLAQALNVSMEPGQLQPVEWETVKQLAQEKYRAEGWTARL